MSAGGDRLERSRLAILEHVHRKERHRHGGDAHVHADEGESTWRAHRRQHRPGAGGWLETARHVLSDWWRYHPAHMAVDVARPLLSSYARRQPAQYVGFAALAGAGLFMLRPWKLISVTGVLVALLKSPQVAALVMQAMSASQNPRDDPPLD
ncbi:hypothetical protein [Ramlibacter humi]|uniref:Uncharacterized protein n=1 Tax=Ramlibacter humi TaxID=2530451 RepID=A0A4Z0BXF2_9BURK|nr:hypothetical protein [Ramlibacter humi]TFZ03933.1 hypothetical protein EZ216_09845 [Ramlibacter humi]